MYNSPYRHMVRVFIGWLASNQIRMAVEIFAQCNNRYMRGRVACLTTGKVARIFWHGMKPEIEKSLLMIA